MEEPDTARGPRVSGKRWRRWAVLGLAITVGVVLLSSVWYHRAKTSAEHYALQATSDVTREWAVGPLSARATAGLARAPADSLERYLAFIKSQLGSLTEVRRAEVTGGTLGLRGLALTVRVVAAFEKGDAKVSWLLLKDGGSWKVASVTFDSDQIRLPMSEASTH